MLTWSVGRLITIQCLNVNLNVSTFAEDIEFNRAAAIKEQHILDFRYIYLFLVSKPLTEQMISQIKMLNIL